MQTVEDILSKVVDTVTEAVIEEFIAQGHKATGNLINSIKKEILNIPGGKEGLVTWLFYGNIVNEGVPAQNVKISRLYIEALTEWVKVKGIEARANKPARSLAWAIAKTHQKEGIPSKGSLKFSKTGKRTQFFEGAFKKAIPQFENDYQKVVAETFNEVLRKAQADLNRN